MKTNNSIPVKTNIRIFAMVLLIVLVWVLAFKTVIN